MAVANAKMYLSSPQYFYFGCLKGALIFSFWGVIFDKMINKQGTLGFIKVLEWIDNQ